jgi:hypothetical protein
LFGQLLERLPGTFQFVGLVRGSAGVVASSINNKSLAAASVSRAPSESLNQTGPGSQLGYEAASGDVDPGFHNLSRNDDPIHPVRARGAGQESLSPPLTLGWTKTAMDEFEPPRPSRGAKAVKGSASSIDRVTHDEGDATEVAWLNVSMFFEDTFREPLMILSTDHLGR